MIKKENFELSWCKHVIPRLFRHFFFIICLLRLLILLGFDVDLVLPPASHVKTQRCIIAI